MLTFAAIIIFFTRLPFWRNLNVPSEYFRNVIYYWPAAGWLTASVMAGTLFISSLIFPLPVAITIALISRLLLTGALHEDGLADFFDGFGGGTSKDRILAIMKDSHIGCYGVLGLIMYYLLLYNLLNALPVTLSCIAILAADPFCKGVSAMITLRLNYARKEEESKSKTMYNPIKPKYLFTTGFFGLTPLLILFYFLPVAFYLSILAPITLFFLLTNFMKRKIQGYTGDCAGALFLLLELSFYLLFTAIFTL